MNRTRRANYTATEKVAILREALLEHQPVSEVCERHRLQPSQFYAWQKQFFENGAAAFGREADRDRVQLERRVQALEAQLAVKDSVIADISQEYVGLKEALGAR